MIVYQLYNSLIRKTFSLVFLSLLIQLLGNSPSYSQHIIPKPIFSQFTVDDGLPSNEIYHIIQDSTGYIWIATANGISRFDGYTFNNYGLEDGLIESTIHEIYIDYQNRLWFIANSGKLTFFEKEIINAYQYNHRINDYVDKSRGSVKNSFYVDSLDNVTLPLKGLGILSISTEGILKQTYDETFGSNVIVKELDNEKIILSNTITSNKTKVSFLSNHSSFSLKADDLGQNIDGSFHFFFLKENHNTYIMGANGFIFRIKDGTVVEKRKLGIDVIWISLDKNNNLWVAPIGGGIYLFENADFQKEGRFFLENKQITSLVQDKENGYWFTSLTHGVFYCPNINSLTYNENTGLISNRVTSVYTNRDGLFVGDENGVVSMIKDKKIKNYVFQNQVSSSIPISFIGYDTTSSKVWIGTRNYLHSLENGEVEDFTFDGFMGGIYPRQMIPARDGGYWIASSWGVRKFNGTTLTYSSKEFDEFSGLVYSVYEDKQGALWMGAVNGIWKYENNSYHYLGENNLHFNQPTNHIVAGPNETILFATRGIGLVIKDDDKITKIAQSDGLSSNFINKIFVDDDGVWLATSNGVNFIEGDISNQFFIHHINTSHGLPTNEVNSVFGRGNQIFITSSKGLTVINKNKISYNKSKPQVKITSVRIRDKEINTSSDPVILNYDQNYISIDFVGFSYRNMGKTSYRYRLMGLDSLWIYSISTNVTYSGIKFGDYTFEIQAQNSDGVWGDSTTFSFTISPPFWQTYWFILLLTLVFSGTLFLIYRNRIMSIRRRNELINNLNVYKQQSLRQQMNPHFIFNTLNSIQLYILEKDHISSHKYLTKFAKLMRMILDNSQQPTITLKDEIDALKLYLELESIRLSGKFEYFIDVENNDLLNCQIPTLLIQPFVENSIWHGIMLKPEQDGWVKISINSNNGTIVCTIEDNGVGREVAQAVRSKQEVERKSLGFKITAQRIELLNSLYKNKFSIVYTDLNSSDGKSTGTRVELHIPFSINQSKGK